MVDEPALEVRPLARHEWRSLRDLRLAALEDSPRAFLSCPERERAEVDLDWCELLHSGIWFGAFVATRPAGLVRLVREIRTHRRYVESMWVAPQHRGLGLATGLLRTVQEFVRSERGREMFLWVLDGNEPTREYYLHRGFVPTGRRQPIGPELDRIEEEFSINLVGPGLAGPAPHDGGPDLRIPTPSRNSASSSSLHDSRDPAITRR